jgi:hypothetical protein
MRGSKFCLCLFLKAEIQFPLSQSQTFVSDGAASSDPATLPACGGATLVRTPIWLRRKRKYNFRLAELNDFSLWGRDFSSHSHLGKKNFTNSIATPAKEKISLIFMES